MKCPRSPDGKHHYARPTSMHQTQMINVQSRQFADAPTYCRHCTAPAIIRFDLRNGRVLVREGVSR